jgi:hypothetical protein
MNFATFSKTSVSYLYVMVLPCILVTSAVVIKHLLVLDHFGQENYQTNVYLYVLYYTFHLNTF